MSAPQNATTTREAQQETSSFWSRWVSAANGTSPVQDTSESSSNEQDEGWLQRYVTGWFSSPESVIISDTTSYHQLTRKQVKLLETEAEQGILKGHDTWCWFKDISSQEQSDASCDGELAVFNSGSASCPLPLSKYPLLLPNPAIKVKVKNSLILPGSSPVEYFHHLRLRTKLANAVKNHYNYESEGHLYLKKNPVQDFSDDTILIMTLHGSLPEKYERLTTSKLPTALDLTRQMLTVLKEKAPRRMLSFSLECPLDTKTEEEVLNECLQILGNWAHLFADAHRIFIVGTYHSVPLSIFLTHSILTNFKIPNLKSVGLLGVESCLQGYQFWNHSTEITPNSMENPTFQTNKEKLLFDGCSKMQQSILSRLKNYRDTNSSESQKLLKTLDLLLFDYPHLRFSLVGKLYDNFLTISQKLALDYVHPYIQRRIWCDGNNMNLNHSELVNRLPDDSTLSSDQRYEIQIPKERQFEISIINAFLLAINLGHKSYIPLIKKLSPFFISRSFNEWTYPGPLKKQFQTDLKNWLQEKDAKWKDVKLQEGKNPLQDFTKPSELFEYLYYKAHKNPNEVILKTSIYDDTEIFQSVIDDVVHTQNLQAPKHLSIYRPEGNRVYNSINEYDLVWNLHEAIGTFMHLTNLPSTPAKNITTSISLEQDSQPKKEVKILPVFRRNTSEASKELQEMWYTYQNWKPNTTGLRQLQNIFSVLRLYDSSKQLENDVFVM